MLTADLTTCSVAFTIDGDRAGRVFGIESSSFEGFFGSSGLLGMVTRKGFWKQESAFVSLSRAFFFGAHFTIFSHSAHFSVKRG
jgi:hypothetical protein